MGWRITVVVLLLTGGCQGTFNRNVSIGDDTTLQTVDLDSLVRLYENQNYFALRKLLATRRAYEPPKLTVLRAAVAQAFNDLKRSDSLLRGLLDEPSALSDSLYWEARQVQARNLLRLHRYGAASGVLEDMLADVPSFIDSVEVRDFVNMQRFTDALAGVSAQQVVSRSATVLERDQQDHVPLVINGTVSQYVFDTGANYSVLVRSEAEALGLRILRASVEVMTATDATVVADVAIADSVRVGNIHLTDVVFLLLPDEALTFPGLVIRGIVGFPIIEALGEIRWRRTGTLEIPGEIPSRSLQNLALHELTPLVQLGFDHDTLLCRFDTGANRTQLYEPFYRRYRSWVEENGIPDTVRAGGAGGIRELPGFQLPSLTLHVAGREVTLREVHAHTRVLTGSSDNVLDCNLGQDVLAGFNGYTLNFKSMSFLLN